MKKAVVVMFLLIFCLSSVFAQGQQDVQDGKTQLSLWHYFSTEHIQVKFQEYIDTYNAQSPNSEITVSILPFADFKTQLSVGAAAGELPDIVIIDNCDTVAYAAMGMFADITEEVSSWQVVDDYFPEILSTGKYKGRIYALPIESNNLEIMYNVDMLKEAGVTPPKTFAELKSAAKALTTDEHYGFAVSAIESEEATYQFLPFFWSAGGETMTLDSPEGRKALSLWTDMVANGSMPKECISWSQSELSSQFVAGNVAMMVMGPWQISNYKGRNMNFGVSKIPEDVMKASVYGGENIAVVKGENSDEALKFLEWFLDYERNGEWNYYTDEFVASQKTLEDPKYTEDPYWKPFVEMIPYTRARDVTPAWPEVSAGYQTAIQAALSQQMTVSEALKAGQKQIDQALNK